MRGGSAERKGEDDEYVTWDGRCVEAGWEEKERENMEKKGIEGQGSGRFRKETENRKRGEQALNRTYVCAWLNGTVTGMDIRSVELYHRNNLII